MAPRGPGHFERGKLPDTQVPAADGPQLPRMARTASPFLWAQTTRGRGSALRLCPANHGQNSLDPLSITARKRYFPQGTGLPGVTWLLAGEPNPTRPWAPSSPTLTFLTGPSHLLTCICEPPSRCLGTSSQKPQAQAAPTGLLWAPCNPMQREHGAATQGSPGTGWWAPGQREQGAREEHLQSLRARAEGQAVRVKDGSSNGRLK